MRGKKEPTEFDKASALELQWCILELPATPSGSDNVRSLILNPTSSHEKLSSLPRLNFVIHTAWHSWSHSSRRTLARQGHAGLVTGRGGRTLAGDFDWTVDGRLIGKQTSDNVKGKKTYRKTVGLA